MYIYINEQMNGVTIDVVQMTSGFFPVQCCLEPLGQHCIEFVLQCCSMSIKTTLHRIFLV